MAETLKSAHNLWRIERSIWNACPVSHSSRLHPDLLEYKTIANFCQTFDIDKWVCEQADRAEKGQLDDNAWETLYAYILANGEKIGRRALSAIKRSPVVKDHRGSRRIS